MEAAEISVEAYFRRQMTAIGVSAMEQISLMHVLVIGLRGCGIEIAKCLALSGVQRLTLMDEELVRQEDLAIGFLLRDCDQGKPKAKIVASRLNELAPFADVRTLNGALSLDLLLNFHVVVFASVNVSQEEVIAYDEFCRAQEPPIGVVVAESRGVFGSVFTDFSSCHQSLNTTPGSGDVAFSVVSGRTQVHDEDRVDALTVVVREPLVNAYLEAGDHVTLHELGDDTNPLQLEVDTVLSDVSLRLRPINSASTRREMQARLLGNFTILRRNMSRVFTATHRPLRECVLFPGPMILPVSLGSDDIGGKRSRSLHLASVAVHQFRREFGVLPNCNSNDHVQHMMALVDELLDKNTRCPPLGGAVRRGEIDRVLVTDALRCASSELLPLSALIAGQAALQVLKFSGALGPLLHPDAQFQYFDIIDLARGASRDKFARDSPLSVIFGSDMYARLQNATVAVVGAGSVNMEVLKNLLCCGIGYGGIHFVLDPDERAFVQAEDLHGRVLFSPALIGQSKVSALKAFRKSTIIDKPMNELSTALGWETWTDCSTIVAQVSSVRSRLAIDYGCRVYEKTTLFTYEDARGLRRTDVVVPHTTATFSERLIATKHKSQSGVFPFDHLPTPSRPCLGDRDDHRLFLLIEHDVQRARRCFEMIFQVSIQAAARFLESTSSSKTAVKAHEEIYDEEKILWMTWSVAHRAHGVEDFKDCLRVAWVLLELLPVWMDIAKTKRSTRAESTADTKVPSNTDGYQHAVYALLEIDTNDPDQIQLLVATACIVAASVQVAVPPVENRRTLLTQVMHESRTFSLHNNPRTPGSIRDSFAAIDSSHMLGIVARVTQTKLDLDDVHKGHLHFLQSLANLQLSWSKQNDSRITSIPQLRRIYRDQREFLPLETILGAVTTLQLMQVLLSGKSHRVANEELREYVTSTIPTGSSALLRVARSPTPLTTTSIPLEITRGMPLRVIPEEMSRWTKIVVPTSAALQSAKALVLFVETKFQIAVHAIHHEERCVATVSPQAMSSADGPLTQSLFDLCGSSAPFVLLDLVAVDGRGDVVLAPLRVQRKV